jgi:Protein of unknown function (DUF2716)
MAAPPVWWEFEYGEWIRASELWDGREVQPSVSYDLRAALGELGSDVYGERVDELYARCLDVFCLCCTSEEWIYAVDVDHYAFRFWPHRGRNSQRPWRALFFDESPDSDDEQSRLETFDGPGGYAWEQQRDGPWPVGPIPDGDDQLFVAQDFSWGLYAKFLWSHERQDSDWLVHVWGEPLVEAFAHHRPAALSHPLDPTANETATHAPLIPLNQPTASVPFGITRRLHNFRRDHLSVLPLVTRITFALMSRRSAKRKEWRSSRTAANERRLRRRPHLAGMFFRLQLALLNRALSRRRR